MHAIDTILFEEKKGFSLGVGIRCWTVAGSRYGGREGCPRAVGGYVPRSMLLTSPSRFLIQGKAVWKRTLLTR